MTQQRTFPENVSQPTIPDAAIEAGAKAIWDIDREDTHKAYEDCSEGTKRHLRREARATLEAAAPYILADATTAIEEARVELARRRDDFEQAADKMPNPTDPYGMNQREWLRTVANPYRSQP